MQRRILATLDEAKAAAPKYPGAVYDTPTDRYTLVRVGAVEGRLPNGVYDLRCSARYLAQVDGHRTGTRDLFASRGFMASFSRAAHTLFRCGAVKHYFPQVPLRDAMRFDGWQWRDLGDFALVPCGSQLRFVTLSANHTKFALSYAEFVQQYGSTRQHGQGDAPGAADVDADDDEDA
jgi:hypothetical protein